MNALFLALACAPLLPAPQDSVTLKDGKLLEGRVVFDGAAELILRQRSKETRIAQSDVSEVHSLERSLAAIIARDIGADDAAALETAARECEEAGLVAEARIYWLRLLLHDPQSEAAAEGLGARRFRDDWKIPFWKQERRLSELRETQEKWRDAIELPTTHFELRSDLPLGEVLELALALERFHVRFYSLLGDPLELRVFDERALPEVRVYGTEKSWPTPPAEGDRAWFGAGENCLHVRYDGALDVRAAIAELSRQMLFSAMRRGRGPNAQVPPWVASGIGQFFAIAAPSQRGGPWSEIGEPYRPWFRLAADSGVELKRLLISSHNDFSRGGDGEGLTACAYALVHYFARGENGALRAGFGRYLIDGAQGKVSVSALEKALDAKVEDLDQRWRAYARSLAGN